MAQSPVARKSDPSVALVLSGAGSRGAYEAGVLSVLLPLLKGANRPRVIVGTSAGALNAAMLASVIDRGGAYAAEALVKGWESLTPEKVFAQPYLGAVSWARWHLGQRPPKTATALFDTSPLAGSIQEILGRATFGHNVTGDVLDGIGIVASSCSTSKAVVFVECHGRLPRSPRQGIKYLKAKLGIPHLMASSAFPLAFAPQWVDDGGGDWYIDGGLHLNSPLKPAIDLGADRLLVVGGTLLDPTGPRSPSEPPNATDENAQILHALLADRLVTDLDRLKTVNSYVRARGPGTMKGPVHRSIKTFVVNPTDDYLSQVATEVWPSGLSQLLGGIGRYPMLGSLTLQKQRPGEFLSYLCFDQEFISKAIEIGKRDANKVLDGAKTIRWK